MIIVNKKLNVKARTANMGLLLRGWTEGNPGIIPPFNFGNGVDRLPIGFSF